jgi:hypothetical protein
MQNYFSYWPYISYEESLITCMYVESNSLNSHLDQGSNRICLIPFF